LLVGVFVVFYKQFREDYLAILINFTGPVRGNGLEIVLLTIGLLFPIFGVTTAVFEELIIF